MKIIQTPGDKSISHRALILSAIAEGTTHIHNLSNGTDCQATLQALKAMGVSIVQNNKMTTVEGVGLHGLQAAPKPIDCGNSGTSMRLLAGLLAAQSFDSELIGDASLSMRPMARIVNPLIAMGANISMTLESTAPLKIKGCQSLNATDYTLPVASAQVKSGLLIASLYTSGEANVIDPFFTRDHTERLLKLFNYKQEGGLKSPGEITIPCDISAAAFFIVAATITLGSAFLLEKIGVNPTRMGIVENLKIMGADITLLNERFVDGEPIADIQVRYAPLTALTLSPQHIVNGIDEFPILFIAAACAQGTSIFSNLQELRVKESDRIEAMTAGLTTLGIKVVVTDDTVTIIGGSIQGGVIDAQADHRVAMAFAIARSVASGEIQIKNCDTVTTSFPDFWKCCEAIT